MIALCHLVRKANGPEPFERFIGSYEEHDAGVDHELVIIFKGFDGPGDLEPFRRRLEGHAFHEVQVPDDGLDVGAYFSAARELHHERVCFLNSFSAILAGGWLGHLDAALSQPGTGLVGATGSWASHRSYGLYLMGVPNVYRRVLGTRTESGPAFREAASSPKMGRIRGAAHVLAGLPKEIVGYRGFPAAHLRTNAFAIGRALFLEHARRSLRSKTATYRFEAGAAGLTSKVIDSGMDVKMVTRGGDALAPADWSDVAVFWQGNQGELMVADNQTGTYSRAEGGVRRVLSGFAWGERSWSYQSQQMAAAK